jgi:hypothetical protein
VRPAASASGTIVTLICDSGAGYTTTNDDDIWLKEQGIDISPYLPVVERAWDDKVCDGPYSAHGRNWLSKANDIAGAHRPWSF